MLIGDDNKLINILKNKYSNEINDINNQYKELSFQFNNIKLQEIMKRDSNLIVNLINDILLNFDELNDADFIMLNGSYARGTNVLGSDLDFNIMYKDSNKSNLLEIELRINYILSRILNFRGCDRIHSIMVYTNLITTNNFKLVNDKLYFSNKKINYYCRENYEKLLYETINTSRDYNELLKYFDKKITKKDFCYEWLNNFLLVKDYGKYNDFISKIKENNYIILKNDNKDILIKKINKIISNINKINNNNLMNNNLILISELKFRYKSLPLNIVYDTLSVLSVYYKNKDLINLDTLKKKEIISHEFYNYILLTLWNIMRIHIVVDSFGYDLSSHSTKKINKEEFYNKYYQIYKVVFDDFLRQYEEKYYSYLKNKLIKIKRKLEE